MANAHQCDACGTLYASAPGIVDVSYNIATNVKRGDIEWDGWSADLCPKCSAQFLALIKHGDPTPPESHESPSSGAGVGAAPEAAASSSELERLRVLPARRQSEKEIVVDFLMEPGDHGLGSLALIQLLRAEAQVVPHRRGRLYERAANVIEAYYEVIRRLLIPIPEGEAGPPTLERSPGGKTPDTQTPNA